MVEQLCLIIKNETKVIENLLKLLEEQHSYIIKNDIFAMEACVEKIESCSRDIASCEINRRNITKDKSMKEVIENLDDEQLDKLCRDMNKLLFEVKLQKETNEILLRQGLGFTNNLLNRLNPDRSSNKTYNYYGKIYR